MQDQVDYLHRASFRTLKKRLQLIEKMERRSSTIGDVLIARAEDDVHVAVRA